MHLTYDAAADAAYIYLDDLPVDATTQAGPLALDWAGPTLIGIEVIAASTVLPPALLKPATAG